MTAPTETTDWLASDTVVAQIDIRNDEGQIVGGWTTYANGERCGWYAPYIPQQFLAPNYLAITREVVEGTVTNER